MRLHQSPRHRMKEHERPSWSELPAIMTVLENSVEKLKLLSQLSVDGEAQAAELSASVGEELGKVSQEQRDLEGRFEELLAHRRELEPSEQKFHEKNKQIHQVVEDVRSNTMRLSKSLKENPNVSENLQMIQSERSSLLALLQRAKEEVELGNGYGDLVNFAEEDEARERKVKETLQRQKELAADVRELRAALTEEKEEHERNLQSKTNFLSSKKVEINQKKTEWSRENRHKERALAAENAAKERVAEMTTAELEKRAQELRDAIESEKAVHNETSDFLNRKRASLQDQLNEWMRKYEADKEAKSKELDQHRNQYNREVNRLRSLEESYSKALQEKERNDEEERSFWPRMPPAEPGPEEHRCATLIQACWRGYRDRLRLGICESIRPRILEARRQAQADKRKRRASPKKKKG